MNVQVFDVTIVKSIIPGAPTPLINYYHYLKWAWHINGTCVMETLHHLFHILRDNRCSDDVIMTSLAEAYQIHHDDSLSLNLIGQKCRESGFNEQAEFFFREALCDDTNNPLIKENLRDLYERLINRWHFTMLNDVTRNSLYFKSIKEATHDDTTVLDIGSGTGILRYVGGY